jgi:RNA polymerase sigma factor (sigma-70 family)
MSLVSRGEELRTDRRLRARPAPIQVLVVDDHQLVADGLGMLINSQADMVVAGFARSVAESGPMAASLAPDVVVMDFHLKDGTGLDAAMVIRRLHPDARFVFLSRDDTDLAWMAAIEAGASAFVHKSRAAAEVIDAVRQVGNGANLISPTTVAELLGRRQVLDTKRESLSEREREVLRLMAEGKSSRDIAKQLGISYSTVRTHIRGIDAKLDVHSKLEAVVTARELSIIE